MKSGFFNQIYPLIDYTQLLKQTYILDQPYDITQFLVSKQTVDIQLSDQFIISICPPYLFDILNNDINIDIEDQFINQPDPDYDYDTIEFFGAYNKFLISPQFLAYYKKTGITKTYATVFGIQKAKQIPNILSNCNTNFVLNKNLNLQIPSSIVYSYFKQPSYYILDKAQTGFESDIYVLAINIPYDYYKKAITITDQQCCYDIKKQQFWFASSNIQHYQSLLTDIATNGLYNPIPLRLNDYGQIISCEDTRTRTLIALQLKLPYIPAIIYKTVHNNNQAENFKIKDLRQEANQIFNPYFIFDI